MEIKIDNNLKLETVSLNDAEETYELIDSHREYLREWLPWVNFSTSVEDTISNIKSGIENNEAGTSLHLSIKSKGKIIGRIGFRHIDKSNNTASIGYWLSKSEMGKGIITKAVDALCNYSFKELNINRIEIQCATENHKSKAIPERLGFKIEGILREKELVNGVYQDHRIYSKLAPK
jgi:ribosomal-protein-serine acetyltransferase